MTAPVHRTQILVFLPFPCCGGMWWRTRMIAKVRINSCILATPSFIYCQFLLCKCRLWPQILLNMCYTLSWINIRFPWYLVLTINPWNYYKMHTHMFTSKYLINIYGKIIVETLDSRSGSSVFDSLSDICVCVFICSQIETYTTTKYITLWIWKILSSPHHPPPLGPLYQPATAVTHSILRLFPFQLYIS